MTYTSTFFSFFVSSQKVMCEIISVADRVVDDGILILQVLGGIFLIGSFERSIIGK